MRFYRYLRYGLSLNQAIVYCTSVELDNQTPSIIVVNNNMTLLTPKRHCAPWHNALTQSKLSDL